MSLISIVNSDPISSPPRLASLAADSLLNDSESTIKAYKDKRINEYPIAVKQLTEFDLQQLKDTVTASKFSDSVFIYTTGSDGKHEKANRKESPIELIVVSDEETTDAVRKKVEAIIESSFLPVDSRIEYKSSKERLITCEITKTVIPSRFLHNLPLFGSEEKLDKFILQFINEIQNMKSRDKRKFNDNFVNKHTKQMRDVIDGKSTDSVDLSNGILHYSGFNKATKYPLLRPIQYKLDLVLIDAIRAESNVPGSKEKYAKIIKNMPRQVPDQIEYMHRLGMLSNLDEKDIKDLQAAYTLGLFYFQTAQHLSASHDKQSITFSIPDKEELQAAFVNTQRILAKI